MSARYFTVAFLLFGFALAASAQFAGPAEDAAITYLERNWNRHDLASQADVAELVITDAVESRHGGATSVHLRQGIDGISVIDGQMVLAVDDNGHVFHAAGQLIPDLASRTVHSGNGVGPAAVANTIASEAGFPAPVPFEIAEPGVGATQRTVLTDGGGHSHQPVIAELVYIVDDAGDLRLAWDATITLNGDDGQWRGLVDAGSGAVLRLDDVLLRDHFGTPPEKPLILKRERSTPGMTPLASSATTPTSGSATYEVVAWPQMDPFHTDPMWPDDGRTIVSGVEDPTASPCGWHDINDPCDGADYTITQGNNVHAYGDLDGTNSPNPEGPDGGTELSFEFPVDFTLDAVESIEASTTNLFYWNNLFHDVMVHYGFDEAHWNFQETNYTGDGAGGDYVNAEALDNYNGASCNNANFSRTTDGQNPRMQMFKGCNWDVYMDGSFDNHVIIHEYGHGVSIRMTGGGSTSSCLSNQEHGGEGWSDWYGLMLTQDETAADFGRDQSIGVGVFLFYDDNPDGIRPTPYNTDFTVNPTTYGDIGGLIAPHGVGYAWATILWEVTWDLIDEYGYNQDITAVDDLSGNIMMMNLVTEALNMTPCSPGFVDQRDAILAAVDVVYSDQTEQWRSDLKQFMWGGFARRGLGFLADQGSPNSTGDETEDFTVPSEIAPNAVTDLAADPDGDFVTLTWTAPDDDDSDVLNYHVRYATSPILNETDWDNATEAPGAGSLVPQAPGETEEFMVTGLDFETEYHFAVRSDDGLNISDVSNSAEGITLEAPVADVPTDPIEVDLNANETEDVLYTFSNLGPSTLTYGISFNETTDALEREAIPSPGAGPRDVPERTNMAPHSEESGEPQLMDEGGPDEFGYTWVDSNEPHGPTYEWIDITETGTELSLGLDDYEVVDLPFDFPFYENTYDWVAIQSKASLAFEDAFMGYVNQPIPTAGVEVDAVIAGYWDDLNPSSSGGGAVYYDTLDDGRFVVSYDSVQFFAGDETEYVSVQIILEPSGAIITQYKDIVTDSHADSETIGIESPDGTDGLEVVYNAPYVEEELAIRFSSLWVSSDLTAGMVPAADDEELMLTFESSGLTTGTYTADMLITTNEADGLTQEHTVPLTLNVDAGAVPVADISPGEFAFEVPAEGSDTQDLNIGNTGDADLTWEIMEAESDGLGDEEIWSEGFDEYDVGSPIAGQGGWENWDEDEAWAAFVSDDQANSESNSLDILEDADVVRQFDEFEINSGQWVITAQQYIPDDFDGTSMFIMLNTYAPSSTNNWSTQVEFSSATGMVQNCATCSSGGELPMTTGEWVEIRVEIDLDEDTQTFYYGGEELYSGTWTDEVSGGGELTFDTIDLFANSASSVYYDDLSVTQIIPTGCEAPTDISWLSVSPEAGTTPGGESAVVEVTADATGQEPETDLSAVLCVTTNDPFASLVEIPVALSVGTIGTEDDLAFEGTHRLSPVAPNPINGSAARTTLEVAEAQDVRIELFDVRGRRVATPFEGALAARTAQEIALDGNALAPGVYVLRISGETFAETRRVTVAR